MAEVHELGAFEPPVADGAVHGERRAVRATCFIPSSRTMQGDAQIGELPPLVSLRSLAGANLREGLLVLRTRLAKTSERSERRADFAERHRARCERECLLLVTQRLQRTPLRAIDRTERPVRFGELLARVDQLFQLAGRLRQFSNEPKRLRARQTLFSGNTRTPLEGPQDFCELERCDFFRGDAPEKLLRLPERQFHEREITSSTP